MKNKLLKVIHNLRYKNHPRESYLYGIVDGVYKGTSIIFFDLNTVKDSYNTLAIAEVPEAKGGMRILTIPAKAVKEGFDKGIIQKIKSLPSWSNNIFTSEFRARMNILNLQKKDETI